MSRFVFVLGAGASADAGGPLASNFMEKARQFLRSGRLQGKDKEAFDLVFKAREALKAVHSKANLDLGNLEVLFNAFEMAALFNRLGSLAEEEVQALPDAMRRLIGRTIEANLIFPVKQNRPDAIGHVVPPYPYKEFTDLLVKMSKNRFWGEISVITFNYDLAADFAFYKARTPFSYGLDSPVGASIDFLKLHGSLNWRRCPKCRAIVPWHLQHYFQEYDWRDLFDIKEVRLQMSLSIPKVGHCEIPLEIDPTIVPPTWNKGAHHSQLRTVWRKAASHLSQAEYIFIIGYSYPTTDEFFKYLYALGSVGDGWLEKVYVFNPDAKVGERIGALLGPLAKDRYVPVTNNFAQAISVIEDLGLS